MYPHQYLGYPDRPYVDTAAENYLLREQVKALNERVSVLEAENRLLRTGTVLAPPPSGTVLAPPLSGTVLATPQSGALFAAPTENALALPAVIESLAVMREHFRRQGTLKQCSTPGCHRLAFDTVCFRLGHMAWCGTHNRVITGTYTSCSVKAEERGDCIPIFWEQRPDWQQIVDRAYREGKIGNKGVTTQVLNALLFSPMYNPMAPPGNYSPLNDGRW